MTIIASVKEEYVPLENSRSCNCTGVYTIREDLTLLGMLP